MRYANSALFLPEDTKEALRREAKLRGLSQAETARRLLRRGLGLPPTHWSDEDLFMPTHWSDTDLFIEEHNE